jgi:hypothetical protein
VDGFLTGRFAAGGPHLASLRVSPVNPLPIGKLIGDSSPRMQTLRSAERRIEK